MNTTNNATNDTNARVWFITGASRGLGAELAKAALAAGDRVVATARDPKTVTARFGERPELLAVRLDVTDPTSIAAAVETAIAAFGRIDVLVNNAGFGIVGALEETSAADIRKVYDTNVFGLVEVTRAALPHLRRQRSGHVLNLSSIGGYVAYPGYSVYCSTKFAVEGISEALAGELAPLGIHVTVIEPGFFRTEFLADNSVIHAPTRIADYDGSAGATRAHAIEVNGKQPGDPAKLAQALLDLVRSPSPPVRLALGSDAIGRIEAKNASVVKELEAWRKVSTSTDFTA